MANGMADRLSSNQALADIEVYNQELQKKALADRLANEELKAQYVSSFKPKIDLSQPLAFFSGWTGNQAPLSAYKSPEENITQRLAAAEKLFPTQDSGLEKQNMDILKTKLETAMKQEEMKNKGDSMASFLQKLSIEEKLLNRKEKEQKKEIPGYERLTGTVPTDKDVETLKNVQAKYAQASKGLKDLQGLVSQHGIEIMPGPTKTKMQSIYSDLKIQLKELANLGALTGPDVAILEQQLKDPTSLMSIGQGESTLESIKQTLDNVRQKVASESVARGYEPKFLEKEIVKEVAKKPTSRTDAIAKPKMNADDFAKKWGIK